MVNKSSGQGLKITFAANYSVYPWGCDVCYTNHTEADQDDMDNLITLLAVAGCNFFMGVPGADDIMLNYQSTSFHDSQYLRQLLNLKPAPEFETWLTHMGITDEKKHTDADKQAASIIKLF